MTGGGKKVLKPKFPFILYNYRLSHCFVRRFFSFFLKMPYCTEFGAFFR